MKKSCLPDEIALKSFFLGPQAENAGWTLALVLSAVTRWFDWRKRAFPKDGPAISREDQETSEFKARKQCLERELGLLLDRFEAEIPKFSPRYVGHMVSEISLPGFFGHLATLFHNPNNISAESAPVGVAVEKDAIASLCAMVGYPPEARGHFTSGGTLANLEAMDRARIRLARRLGAGSDLRGRRPVILLPGHAHYSWKKGARLLGLGEDLIERIALDGRGALDAQDLRAKLRAAREAGRPVLMVVSVAGTTETGTIDPVDEVAEILREEGQSQGAEIWHHVDAAFGGFFAAMDRAAFPARAARALEALGSATSLTLDPHKLGYVPYASGVFLCREPGNYELPVLEAPYIDFSPSDPGRVTIEGSRSAGGATATYLAARTLGFGPDGLGRVLARTFGARAKLAERLAEASPYVRILPSGDSNIVCFCAAAPGESASQANARTRAIYSELPARGFYPSKTELSASTHGELLRRFVGGWDGRLDTDRLLVIRFCIMNPFTDSKEMALDFPQALAQEISRLAAARKERS
jgi:glutamate/tyrosine decarboxylase-like PLP-dependent enzyme